MFRPIVVVVSLVLLATGLAPVAAQDASPAASGSALAALGYPEFRVVVSAEGAEAPPEAAAGRHLVVLENGSEEEVDITFFKAPEGETLESLMAATPSAEGEEGGPPAWLYEAEIAGGIVAPAGGVGMVVVDLTAGEWFVDVFRQSEEEGIAATPAAAEGEAEGESQPLPVTVTGDAASPPAAEEPAGAVVVEMQEFAFVMPASYRPARRSGR